MFFIISKAISFLLAPTTWITLAIFGSLVFKKAVIKKRLLLFAAVGFLFFSNLFIVDEVYRLYEVPAIQDSTLTHYNQAIVLGGMSGWDPQFDRIQFYNSSDRLWQTIRLQQQGIVNEIIISGGSGKVFNPEDKEAIFLENYLKEIKLDTGQFIFESESRNTYENAAISKKLLRNTNDTVLLVSSAFHLRRASACFSKAGIPHICYSTDRHVGDRKFELDHLLIPDPSAFIKWTFLFREWTGLLMYQLKGYI